MISNKNNNYFLTYFLVFIFSFFQIIKSLVGQETSFYPKSYFGSILSGQIANYNNDSKNAAKFFNYAHQINPNNAQLYNLSLMSLLLNGKVAAAIKKVKDYKNLQGKSNFSNMKEPIAELLLFIDAVNNNRNSEALKILNSNKDVIISKKLLPILKSWLSKNYDLAKENLDQYEYKSEGLALSDLYYYHLALLSNYYDKKAVTFEAFNKSLKDLTGEKIRTLFFYSNFLKANIEYTDTNKYIEKFINKNPSHSFVIYLKENNKNSFLVESSKDGISETIYNLAENLYGQGLYDTSIVFCQISIFLNKNNIIAKYLLAQNFQVLNQRPEAINILQSINLKSYLGWNTYLKISDLYLDIKDYKNAKKYLLELKGYKNDRIDLFYKIGELYHSKKAYSNAIQAFTSGVELIKKEDKTNWYIYYSRGMSYERSNKWAKAEKDFLYALKLFPDQPLVLNYLGYSWIDLGKNIEKAQNLIKKAVKLRPNDGYFIDSLGWAYYRMGNYNEAVLELEKAVSLIPNDPIINDHLGDALWRAGYENEAVFQWNRALLYNPNSNLKEKIKFKLKKGL